MEIEHYYKYKSLENLRYFLDILINKRLYAARFVQLNDPMEGVFMTDEQNKYMINLLRSKKYKTRICSLTKDHDNVAMWAHYANNHKGCCIEISIRNRYEHPVQIQYIDDIPQFYNAPKAEDVLSYKAKMWSYEREFRFFRKGYYLNVNIHKIIFGLRVSQEDFLFYKKLIKSIDSSIEVIKKENQDFVDNFR